MPIKEITKYQTSDGRTFDNEKKANLVQEALNKNALNKYNNEIYIKLTDKWKEDKGELGAIMRAISNRNFFDRSKSDDILCRLIINHSRTLYELVSIVAHNEGGEKFPVAGEKAKLEIAKTA
jgi:hypothetical protein